MRKTILCFSAILFVVGGCSGKLGSVSVDDNTFGKPAQQDYGIHKTGQIKFGVLSPVAFSGRPHSLSYYAYTVDVNLKGIQETVANRILQSIYDDVVFTGGQSEFYSSITEFSYSWEFSMASKPDVSFKLSLYYIKDGKRILYKEVKIKDFNGGEEKSMFGGAVGMLLLGPIGALLGNAANKEPDKRSQLVTNTVVKAVYAIYQRELPNMVRSFEGNHLSILSDKP